MSESTPHISLSSYETFGKRYAQRLSLGAPRLS